MNQEKYVGMDLHDATILAVSAISWRRGVPEDQVS